MAVQNTLAYYDTANNYNREKIYSLAQEAMNCVLKFKKANLLFES
jgi:hypothetical protein